MHRACIIDDMCEHAVSLTDEEVVGRVIQGDGDAFRYLLDRYGGRVFGIIGRRVPPEDVAEVVHDTFVRAYTSLSTYEGKGDFSSWLAKIAVRTSCDYWRERYRRREIPMSSLNEEQLKLIDRLASAESGRQRAAGDSREEARELLAWAMARLSAADRSVLELVHLEERPVKEAAELLGWSIVNVKVRAYRSRRKLRAILGRLLAEREEHYEKIQKDA